MGDREEVETKAYLANLENLVQARTAQLKAAVGHTEELVKFVRHIQAMKSLEEIQDAIRARFGTLEDAAAAAVASVPKVGGEPGTPVPAVDPDDLKAVWEIYRDVKARHAGRGVAIGLSAMAASCKPGADVEAVAYRVGKLWFVIHFLPEQFAKQHEQKLLDDAAYEAALGQFLPIGLSNDIREGRLDDAFFRAGAKVSMRWMGSGIIHSSLPFDVDEFVRLCKSA